jgi:hypothetical protein
MPSLLRAQWPLKDSIQSWLNQQVNDALVPAAATPATGSKVIPFDTGWRDYTVTDLGDWYFTLHSFRFRVVGDVWIGPADSAGNRRLQVRYRSQIYDLYDFTNTGPFDFEQLAEHGWAAEFFVVGDTTTRSATVQAHDGTTPVVSLVFAS